MTHTTRVGLLCLWVFGIGCGSAAAPYQKSPEPSTDVGVTVDTSRAVEVLGDVALPGDAASPGDIASPEDADLIDVSSPPDTVPDIPPPGCPVGAPGEVAWGRDP